MIALSREPLRVEAIEASVISPSCGALLTFVGTMRNSSAFGGRGGRGLFYEAYTEMAIRELQAIYQEVVEKWPVQLAMVHRLGELGPMEVAVEQRTEPATNMTSAAM